MEKMDNQFWHQQRLQYLFDRYLTGAVTTAELDELWLLVSKMKEKDAYPENLREWWDHYPGADLSAGTDGDKILTRILATKTTAIDPHSAASPSRPHKTRLRLLRISMSAAACLILFCRAMYLLQHHQAPVIIAGKLPDLPPGGNKAILTLADGRKIDLTTPTYHVKEATSSPSLYNTIETPPGGQFHLVLSDGTGVWLNSASSIRYPTSFGKSPRTVEITGEAYFEVTKDPSRPFRAVTSNMAVQVLGTAFNIMAYPNDETIRTTLITGAVKVSKENSVRSLTPGQQAVLPAGTGQFDIIKADLREVLAWKNGEFRFNDADITSIMRQIARWYDVEIVYQGPIPQNKFFGIIPRQQNVSAILEVLELTQQVHFRIEGRRIIVMPHSITKL